MRFTVRVKPRARIERVGGRWGDEALVVAVTAPAVDGRANEAVVRVLAGALDVRPALLRIVSGGRHRTKVVEVTDAPPGLAARIEELRRS